MSNYTEYYNLKKPIGTETYSVDDANSNNDIIDTVLYSKVQKEAGKGLSSNDFTDNYKKKIDGLQKIYKFKGNVSTFSKLSTKAATNGDVYNVLDTSKNYAWNGTEWIEMGVSIDLSGVAMKNEVATSIYTVTTTETIAENTDYEIPCYYKVGNNSLDVFYQGENLIKDVHYKEVGTAGTISNKIQFYNWGQAVPTGRVIKFVVRGVYTSES